jgi:hypothetical protein
VESRRPDGRRCFCRECGKRDLRAYRQTSSVWREAATRWYKANHRRRNLRYKYDLTEAEFDAMLVAQGGGCAICRTSEPGGPYGRFNVDHDHETGRVRGLLCHGCNVALGILGDNAEAIRRVLAYLTENKD